MKVLGDKRVKSSEGFLLADAVIMKTGPLPYLRNEVGLDGSPNAIINIDRSREVIERALPSMVGAPVTDGHPARTIIDSQDAEGKVVGSVVSIPTIDSAGFVRAKIRVYTQDAVNKIESGTNELSPGAFFVLRDYDGKSDNAEIQDMSVNHVAIVESGRAGHQVRVLDSLPRELSNLNTEVNPMIEDQKLTDLIEAAVDKTMKTQTSGTVNDMKSVKDEFVESIKSAMKPALDSIAEFNAAQEKAVKEAELKVANDTAEKERKELIDQVIADERARYSILADALPFITEDKRADIQDKDAKSILVAAVCDSVADAESKSVDYLRGALDNMIKTANDTSQKVSETLPRGVVTNERVESAQSAMAKIYNDRYNNRGNAGAK